MKKIKLLSLFLFIYAGAIAQSSDATLTSQMNQIKNETVAKANTATRLGNALNALVLSKINIDQKGVANGVGSLNSSGLLPPSQGGTGIGNYTIGDIFVASATGTLSKLAIGTSAYVLTSNGPGVLPSWQAVSGGGGGLADPGSNGILKRTSLNTTAAATAGTDYTTPASAETVTNKNISGSTNTLSNIAQSSITNLTSDLAAKAALVSPSFTTPALGVASATSINKVTVTAPATASTLTIADGKTLTASNTLIFSGTDGSTLNIGTGGTLGSNAYTSTAYTTAAAVPALIFQNLTTAIASTWTITTNGLFHTNVFPASGSTLTAVTLATDLSLGCTIVATYSKTTASDLTLTLPSGTTGTDQNGNELSTNAAILTSGTTGQFVVKITRTGASSYTFSIKRDKA